MAKYNLGCGPLPIHEQHLAIMGDMEDWVLVDKYIQNPKIKNWDAEILNEISPNSAEVIYASHLLEHLSHARLERVLGLWYEKLKPGGKLILNVPDMVWTCQRLLKMESGQFVAGNFSTWLGERNIWEIFYGTHEHEGEYHNSGFTEGFLNMLLRKIGFAEIITHKEIEGHDMQCIIAEATK